MRRRGKNKIDYKRELALVHSGSQWSFLGIFLFLVAVLPFALTWTHYSNWLTFTNFTLLTIIAVLGLNITSGMAGLFSLGHAAFLLVGGYGIAVFTVSFNWPFWLALVLATLLTGLAGLVVATLALRLRGFYVAVSTMAFFYIAQFIIRNLPAAGGIFGLTGVPHPSMVWFSVKSDIQWYFLLFAFCSVATLISLNIRRSQLGRSFFAIRDNEDVAASMGINVRITKLRAFTVGALFAGLAGGLWTSYVGVIRVDQFSLWDSIWFLGMIIIGGMGSTTGTILGVISLRMISQILHALNISGIIPFGSNVSVYITYSAYGIAIILFVTLQPYGLIYLWHRLKVNYKRWPFGV